MNPRERKQMDGKCWGVYVSISRLHSEPRTGRSKSIDSIFKLCATFFFLPTVGRWCVCRCCVIFAEFYYMLWKRGYDSCRDCVNPRGHKINTWKCWGLACVKLSCADTGQAGLRGTHFEPRRGYIYILTPEIRERNIISAAFGRECLTQCNCDKKPKVRAFRGV